MTTTERKLITKMVTACEISLMHIAGSCPPMKEDCFRIVDEMIATMNEFKNSTPPPEGGKAKCGYCGHDHNERDCTYSYERGYADYMARKPNASGEGLR